MPVKSSFSEMVVLELLARGRIDSIFLPLAAQARRSTVTARELGRRTT
jgi:hypothetical protein